MLLLDQFLNQTFSDTKPSGYFSGLTFFLPRALSLFLTGGRGNRISLVLAIRYSNYPLYLITPESAVSRLSGGFERRGFGASGSSAGETLWRGDSQPARSDGNSP